MGGLLGAPSWEMQQVFTQDSRCKAHSHLHAHLPPHLFWDSPLLPHKENALHRFSRKTVKWLRTSHR